MIKRNPVLRIVYSGYCKIALAAMLCAGIRGAYGQDIHFSQFFEAPLLRNPSLAGIFTGDVRAQAVYRDQWNSFTQAYRSGSLNAEYKMPIGKADDFITAGLQILYDKSGTVGLTTTQFLPAINYHKALRDDKAMYLSLGFMGGLVQKRIDRSKMTTNTSYETGGVSDGETFASPNYSFLDGSVGASFNTTFGAEQKNSFFVGFAYHHLNKPQNSFYGTTTDPLNPKYVISGGVEFTVNEYAYFSIQADQSLQGSFSETIFGALYSYKIGDPDKPSYTLSGGAFMRLKDALIPVIKIGYDPFALAFSYDVNVSQLKTVSQSKGGFELSVSYTGFLDRYNSARDKVLSPRFLIGVIRDSDLPIQATFPNERCYEAHKSINMKIEIGQPAPDFSLYNSEKNKVTLSDYKGKNVLLLFFPQAFTSVCTKELCGIRDNIALYNKTNAVVFGISVDSVFTLKKYKEDQGYNFDLLSDFNKEVSTAYGSIYEEWKMGMKGVSKRSAFLIDKEGIIRYAEVLENASDVPDISAIEKTLTAIS